MGVALLAHGALAAAGDWAILRPGTTHMGESPERPGRGWLALHRDGATGWRLSPVTVHAKRVHDDITEYGVSISSSRPGALILIRLPGLHAGPVATPKGWEEPPERPDAVPVAAVSAVRFNQQDYRFVLEPAVTQQVDSDGRSYSVRSSPLYIVEGARRTLIGESGAAADSDDANRIVWMGDLDGDGRLDFLFSTDGKNSGGFCLYLSRGAQAPELLKAPHCHIGTGC